MRQIILVFVALLAIVTGPTKSAAQNYEELFAEFRAADLTQEDKRFLQAALAFEGHYNGLLDGAWGPISQRALEAYSRQEFGTSTEDWHIAALAFSFFDTYDRDGWAIEQFDKLGLSMFFPTKSAVSDPPTDMFANWRHTNSSVSYSVGRHTRAQTQSLHDFTIDSHGVSAEPYSLRRQNLAITTAEQRNGSILYTRSNYIDGAWSTVMLSANRRDVPILNAIAASISVGYAPPLRASDGGKLEQIIVRTLAFLEEEGQSSQDPSHTPQSSTSQRTSGTGFVVSSSGHVLTNAHVVENCKTLEFGGNPAEVIASSSEFDLALLLVSQWDGEVVAEFSPTPARLNSDVTVAGYPLAGILAGLNVTRGAVSAQLGLGGDLSGMQITAPVQPGNSGGPVLAMDGEVVGVVVSQLDAQRVADATGDIPQNVNFAIRGELAKLFLFQHGVQPTMGTRDTVLSPPDLAELAASFTGFIQCN